MKFYINTNSDNEEFKYIYRQSKELSQSDTPKTLHVYNEPQFCNTTVYRYDVVEITEEQYRYLSSLNAVGDEEYCDEALRIIDSILYKDAE